MRGGWCGCAPATNRISLGLETAFGWRSVTVQATDAAQQTWTISGNGPIVQPRLSIDWWTTAWSTFGVWAGIDALHDHDFSAGLALALHVAPFDEHPPE